ncbi:MAG: hypothetical protein WC728_02740 [Elusimicrobiota bacterium]
MNPSRRDAVLFLCGAELFIIQFAMVRALSGILAGTELVLLAVSASYFLGFSFGYHLCDRMSPGWFKALAFAQWATHLTLPFSLRWAAAWLAGSAQALVWLAPALFVLGGVWISSFYSLLLPRLLSDLPEGGSREFARSYGMEIAGALAGMAVIFAAPRVHPAALMAAYQAGLACILGLLFPGRALWAAGAGACILYAGLFTRLERASVAALSEAVRGIEVRSVLFSADTPYQRVEVLEDPGGGRHLYLDGIRHYGTDPLADFNYFIAGLPASLLKPARAVVVGSGSGESARWALAGSAQVTTVELDPVVAAAGRELLSRPMPEEDASRWRLVEDDAKHFFGRLEGRVGLVVLDIAGPFQRQVALLYALEFFRLVRSRLEPGGAVSVSLNSDFSSRGGAACRIVATLSEVFEDVLVVAPRGGTSYALAGDGLGFGKRETLAALAQAGRTGVGVFDEADIQEHLRGRSYRKISMSDMDIVLKVGLGTLGNRPRKRPGAS